jgi:O-antigen ligase
VDVANPLRKFGKLAALAFLFVRLTGLHEVLTISLGFNTYILYLFGLPAIAAFIFSGGIRRSLEWRPVHYWMGFLVLMIAAVPFSTWRGDSFRLVATYMRTEIIVLFLIVGLILTWSEVWLLLKMLALATLTNISIATFFQTDTKKYLGRLSLVGGTMADPNDFASLLNLMLPFLLLVVITPRRSFVLRGICFAGFLYGIYLILATGSRGAFVALVLVAFYFLLKSPFRHKLLAGAAILMVGIGLTVALPDAIVDRLATLFGREAPAGDVGLQGAMDSSASRIYLFKKSLLFTFQRPVFGVGPGQFSNHEGGTAREEGLRGTWRETHNTYTQVSSEVGIPALVFYLAALVSTYRLFRKLHDKAIEQPPTLQNQRIAAAVYCLMLSFVAFTVSIFFLSLAYRFYLPALTGLAIAVTRAADCEWALSGNGMMPS